MGHGFCDIPTRKRKSDALARGDLPAEANKNRHAHRSAAQPSRDGPSVPAFEQLFLRELIRPPFRIVYRRDPKHVRIVRVWRSERQLELPDEPAR